MYTNKTCICKFSVMSPSNVSPVCMCLGVSTWNWINYLFALSFCVKTDYSIPDSHQLPIGLHLGKEPCRIFPRHTNMSAGIVITHSFFR